ncbi:hypothetical protein SARC_00996 [Sphaeroforma arctica JP610]|uniref:Uncharacterized protein n=1 Tax=Sphaeroforma arctica JP610 TaxID=667725 RepID=A0A0L0GCV7_9EUKA|nr:hypothetical protein SARC_00996 [Sphaeroforma arctica JP610]KNC86850.1 hypothetical protein SARC_00996 [Sphaeroforma arctica JP610]|eukprot:XP_014160752.1 hypothetical protein SARC_00996 [Sphaeroforma arctica JP610]
MIVRISLHAAVWCLSVFGACGAQKILNFEIGWKTLILSSNADLAQLPVGMAKAYGANYDLISVDAQGGLQIQLIDPVTLKPKYNSIVQTSATANGLGAKRAILDDYCAKYNVRRVMLNSGPIDVADAAIYGLSGRLSTSATTVQYLYDTAVQGVSNVVRSGVPIKVGMETEFASSTFWINPAYINTALNKDQHIQPLLNLNFVVTSSDAQYVTDPVGTITTALGGIIHRTPSTGVEVMYFFITANANGLHGPTLAHSWFPWVTKGLFMGQRRLVLDTQIDDFYLDSKLYNTGQRYRTTATDYAYHVTEQYKLNAASAPGSNFTIQMAFNGKGYDSLANIYVPDVNPQSVAQFDKFLWLTHTWNHIDMYCIQSTCAPKSTYIDPQLKACHDWRASACPYTEPVYPSTGYTPYEYQMYELTRNMRFASTVLKTSAHPKVWSPYSIVTPRISGLNYTESIRAMLAAGLRFAVGDNSRADLRPVNPWHPFVATAKVGATGNLLTDIQKANFETEMERLYGAKSMVVIPRFATEIYFDTATQQQLQSEFNSYYGPKCYGYDQSASATDGGYKCNVNSFKFPRDLTATEIIGMEGFRTARNLLNMRVDPYMFHQANLAVVDGVSLLSLWLRVVQKWLNLYVTFPIITYKMDDLALYFLRRKFRDECGLTASVKYAGGLPTSMSVTSQGRCTAVLTHTKTVDSELTAPRMVGTKYGEHDTNYYLPLVTPGKSTVVKLGVAGCSTCQLQPQRPKMYIWDWDDMDAIKKAYKDSATGPVFADTLSFLLRELVRWGVMDGKKFSVTQQTLLPGSGDRKDYFTIGYYAWPCQEALKLYGWGDAVGQCDPPPNNLCVADAHWGSVPYIVCDGIPNRAAFDGTSKDHMQQMTRSVTSLALLWFYSDDDKYAQIAADLLRYFFLEATTAMNPNLQWAQYRPGMPFVGFGIVEMGPWSEMLDAVAIIRTSNYWSEAEHRQLMDWMTNLLQWLETSDNGKLARYHQNNHATWFHNTAIGIAQHAKEYHSYAASFGLQLLAAVPAIIRSQIDNTGLLHEEVTRSKSIHYLCYTLTPFLRIRSMAEKSSNGNYFAGISDLLLQEAIKWTYPYMQRRVAYPYRDIDLESGYYSDVWHRCMEPVALTTRIYPSLKTNNDMGIRIQRDEAYCVNPRTFGHPTPTWDFNTLALFGDISCL